MIIPDGQVRFYSLSVVKCLFPTKQKVQELFPKENLGLIKHDFALKTRRDLCCDCPGWVCH